MNDDTDAQMHEQSLLASLYLDGAATSDERALVETSPEALAEVDALSQVRGVLAATAPDASLSERESHLAGALDVWERMSELERSGEATPADGVDAAAAAALLTPTSTSEGRRGRSGRSGSGRGKRGSSGASQWLLGAAATLVVVAGVAAVVRGFLAEDSANDQIAVESAADDSAELSELEAAEAEFIEGGNVGDDFAPAATDLSDDVANNPEVDNDGLFEDATQAMEEAVDESSDESSDEAVEASSDAAGAAEDPALDEQPSPAAEFDRVDLLTPEDLADYGSLVIPRATGGPVTTEDVDFEQPFNSCEAEFGVEELLEPASYQGQDVIVGVDLDNDIVFAYTENCELVASVALPRPGPQL